ncbi:hypothetical protein FB451DRAFT_476131 [Mycena latifolia]|nr:hypothetical protein FB451DRAFT_476131 [Mycena latifolia]
MLRLFFLCSLVCLVSAAPTVVQMMDWLFQLQKDWTYPRLLDVAKSIEYSGFSSDIVGRIDITGTFIGSELNTEYVFGSLADFGTATNTSLIGVPVNISIAELLVQGNDMSVSMIADFNWTVAILPVQWNLLLMFNDEGQVSQYDTQLVRSSWLFPILLPKLVPRLAAELDMPLDTDPMVLVSMRAAYDICSKHETYCVGELQQYNTTADCMDFIANQIPFGDIWQGSQNTGICRYWHKAMVLLSPAVHCPHIGPSGGGVCIDRDYVQVVTEQVFPVPFIQLPGGMQVEDFSKCGGGGVN